MRTSLGRDLVQRLTHTEGPRLRGRTAAAWREGGVREWILAPLTGPSAAGKPSGPILHIHLQSYLRKVQIWAPMVTYYRSQERVHRTQNGLFSSCFSLTLCSREELLRCSIYVMIFYTEIPSPSLSPSLHRPPGSSPTHALHPPWSHWHARHPNKHRVLEAEILTCASCASTDSQQPQLNVCVQVSLHELTLPWQKYRTVSVWCHWNWVLSGPGISLYMMGTEYTKSSLSNGLHYKSGKNIRESSTAMFKCPHDYK